MDIQHNTLFSMNVTDKSVSTPSEHGLLPCSASIQVSSILTALNLDTLCTEVRITLLSLTFYLSLCVHTEIFSSSGLLLPFESKREDNSPIESWIKIAKTLVGIQVWALVYRGIRLSLSHTDNQRVFSQLCFYFHFTCIFILYTKLRNINIHVQ